MVVAVKAVQVLKHFAAILVSIRIPIQITAANAITNAPVRMIPMQLHLAVNPVLAVQPIVPRATM